MNKKKIIIGSAFIAIIALSAGTTALIAQTTSSNIKQDNLKSAIIANKLNSIINNPINVHSYDNMSSYTAFQALNSEEINLKNAIKSVIKQEIEKKINLFNKINITTNEIINKITVNLPSSISPSDSEIAGVILKYDGIVLTNKTSSNSLQKTFIVDGFKNEALAHNNTNSSSTQSNHNSNKNNSSTNNNNANIHNETIINSGTNIINVANYEKMNTYTAAVALSQHKADLEQAIIDAINNEVENKTIIFNLSSNLNDSEILKNITIILPTTVTTSDNVNAKISNVKLLYNGDLITTKTKDGNAKTFVVIGFNSTTLEAINTVGVGPVVNGNKLNRNTQIANQLSLILNNFIDVANYENMSSYTAQEALNNANTFINNSSTNPLSNLQKAIISAVETEIKNNIDLFSFEGVSYTLEEIINGLMVILPNSISPLNNQKSQIRDVGLFYNHEEISSNTWLGTYTVVGFKDISLANTTIQDKQNQKIANEIGWLLPASLNVADYDNMDLYTANEALQNQNILQNAIIDAIENNVFFNGKWFTVDAVSWTFASVLNHIEITFPKSISNSNALQVKLSYMNIPITVKTPTYTITGFYNSPGNNVKNILANQAISNGLSSFLQDDINISTNNEINSYTALDALYSEPAELKAAIMSAIKPEITTFISSKSNPGNFILTNVLKELSIELPQSISLTNDTNAQIPNVAISYAGILLKTKTGSNTFIVSGFNKNTSLLQNDIDARATSVWNTLNSVLYDTINISNESDISSLTAASALSNDANNLKRAILASIDSEITNDIGLFIVNDLSYTATEITNNITVNLPTAISVQADLHAEIEGVSLLYMNQSLTGFLNPATDSNYFIIDGFQNTTLNEINTNYKRSQQIVTELDLLLPQIINVSAYNNMNLYIASNALINQAPALKQAIISTIENLIQNKIKLFIFDGIAYSSYEIGNNITINLPTSLQNKTISQIPGVSLSYANYILSPNTNSKLQTTFIISGFINTKHS
ncbi:MAG: hypothetical protein IIT78_02325 [Mycoplasmataceae bacterium]|nr:hypothetical protein [Mycoplasmataceae bacterium]